MSNKKRDLVLAAGKAHVRKPNVQRVRDASPQKGYKVVAICLYTEEIAWMDGIKEALQHAGKRRATRSGILHDAIQRLQRHLKDKSPAEILQDFKEQETLQERDRARE